MSKPTSDTTRGASPKTIFEKFVQELTGFTCTGTPPAHGNQDVKYSLELQQNRLKNKNLMMQYNITPRGHFAEGGGLGKSWSDAHYISRMEYRTCRLSRVFYRNQKKVYEKGQDSIFYEIITDVHDGCGVEEDVYTCPNCGAVSTIGELQNGCSYCSTFFQMPDLFPKVTNFFFIKDNGGTKKEVNGSIAKTMVPCMLLSVIGCILYFYTHLDRVDGSLVRGVISGTLSGLVFDAIAGYFLWAILKLADLFKQAGRAMPMVVNATGAGKRFESRMRQYSPEFSFAYFSDKVVSMLKMMIFSDNVQELPIYEGTPVKGRFENIVESTYTGAVALKSFRMQQKYCYVTADVYMEDIYDTGNRMYSRNDKFRLSLRKNMSTPINMHFSVKQIQCKGCGSSFDATRHRSCPSCGRKFQLGEEDWVIFKIEKR